MADAHAVPASMVLDLWPAVSGYLEKAMSYYPFMTAGDVQAQLLAGQAQLLVVVDGNRIPICAVMESRETPSCRVAWILALGGKVGSLAEHSDVLQEVIEGWSRAHGCSSIAAIGRRGWSRAWKQRGWVILPSVTATKELAGA